EDLALGRAQSPFALGEVGDDVRRGAALRDDPVHARVRREVLAPAVDREEEPDGRVQGVASRVRRVRGVRRDAVETYDLAHDAEARAAELPFVRAGMRREHGDGL